MQTMSTISDAIAMQLAHTVRSFPPAREPIAHFGATPSLISSDFVTRLLDRAARGDVSYDTQLAYVLSVVAGWSYSDRETLENRLKYYGFPFGTVDAIAVANSAMLIVVSAFFVRSRCGRVGVLSFRGTEPINALNWLGNLDWFMRPFSGGRVHSGFHANLQAVWDDLTVLLTAAQRPSAPSDGHPAQEPLQALYITGHSLGGALGVLTAAKIFADEGPVPRETVRGIYTFGQPAVGDQNFAAHCELLFGNMLHRHVYAHDIIPHLPAVSSGKFVHFGHTRTTRSKDEPWSIATPASTRQAPFLLAAGIASVASYLARRVHVLAKLPFKYSVEDHSPARYIEASRSALEA